MSPHATPRRFWETRASALAWRINVAAWLERAAPVAFFVASAFAVLFYALRRAQAPLAVALAGLLVAFFVAALVCWWRARRGFYAADEARVLLESHLRLDARLTAASLGLVGWPDEPAALPAVVRWRLGATSGWFGGALALLALALVAPIPRDALGGRPSGPPPALLQAESMLEALKEMKIADPQAIEQLAERAQELARRPPEEQYTHSALEAADALRNQTAVAAAALGRGLESAANAMRAANGPDMKGAAGELAAALSGLRDGALPANKDLLANLPGNEAALQNLSAAQREQLAQQLAQSGAGAQGVAGAQGAGASVPRPDPNKPFGQGQGKGQGQGQGRGKGQGQGSGNGTGKGDGNGNGAGSGNDESGDGQGTGGPGGGGGHAPLALANAPSDAGAGRAETLGGDPLKHFSLGDKLGTSTGAHDTDPAKSAAPMSAGEIAAPASGGEAVWVNRLTPAERAALKKHFK